MPSQDAVVERLIHAYGFTIADQIGAAPLRARGPELFEILCSSMLSARRLDQWSGLAAWLAMREKGWGTPDRLSIAPWKQRVRLLDGTGYIRSPERMSFSLGAAADTIGDRYDGDLGGLRDKAGRDPAIERELLIGLKGVSSQVVDVFFREMQLAWDELFPFADERVLEAAALLKLPTEAGALAELSGRDRFPKLVAALAHVGRVNAFHTLNDEGQPRLVDLREPAGQGTALAR